jgi:hypothetical protein
MQSTKYVNCPKRPSRGILQQAKGEGPDQLHSDQVLLGTIRWEAGPHERRSKAHKTKLPQGLAISYKSTEQMVLMMARQKAGLHERWTKMLKGRNGKQFQKAKGPSKKIGIVTA